MYVSTPFTARWRCTLCMFVIHGNNNTTSYHSLVGNTMLLHLGNVLHHIPTQRSIIAMMDTAFRTARDTVPNKEPNVFYDSEDVVFIAQLLYNTTETNAEVVCSLYPDLNKYMSNMSEKYTDYAQDAFVTQDVVSEALQRSLRKDKSVGLSGISGQILSDALDTTRHEDDDDDEGREDGEATPARKSTKRKAPKRKKGDPPALSSSMTLGDILGHPVHMKGDAYREELAVLDYNAPSFHYKIILQKCEWANTTNNNTLVFVWYMIVFMYVSEELCRRIQEHTDAGISKAYFDGIPGRLEPMHDRMDGYLYGKLTHDKPKKSRVVEKVIKPPLSIVLEELLIFRNLCDDRACLG